MPDRGEADTVPATRGLPPLARREASNLSIRFQPPWEVGVCVCVPGYPMAPTACSLLNHCLPAPGPPASAPHLPAGYRSMPGSLQEPRGRAGPGPFSVGHLPGLSTAHVPTLYVPPGPTPGHRLMDTYSALWRWESLVLQSSSARRRAGLRQASCREPPPCSWGSPWA